MKLTNSAGFLRKQRFTARKGNIGCQQGVCLIHFHKCLLAMLYLRAETAEKRAKALIIMFLLEVVIKVI
jgi:hypothetical protein